MVDVGKVGSIGGSGPEDGSIQFAVNPLRPFKGTATSTKDRKVPASRQRRFVKHRWFRPDWSSQNRWAMAGFSFRRGCAVLAVFAALMALGSPAYAGDFLSSLFGVFSPRPAPQVRALPYGAESGLSSGSSSHSDTGMQTMAPRVASGGSGFCVRTCDGRYFAVPPTGGQSRAATCKSFCPASETKVFTGSSIDSAFSEAGKSYSALPNAFRYRTELVAGCTCNGRDSGGLAKIRIEDDPTLRKGDIVAGPGGALVASRGNDRREAAVAGHGVGRTTRMTLSRLPIVAAQ